MLDGFSHRVHLHSLLACTHRVVGGAKPLFAEPEVISQRRCQLAPTLGIEIFGHLARTPVELLAASDQKQVVGGFLGKGMLEDVLQFGIMYPLAYQLLVGQDAEVRLDVLDALGWWRRCPADRSQRAVLKDPAEDSSRLGYIFRVLG